MRNVLGMGNRPNNLVQNIMSILGLPLPVAQLVDVSGVRVSGLLFRMML